MFAVARVAARTVKAERNVGSSPVCEAVSEVRPHRRRFLRAGIAPGHARHRRHPTPETLSQRGGVVACRARGWDAVLTRDPAAQPNVHKTAPDPRHLRGDAEGTLRCRPVGFGLRLVVSGGDPLADRTFQRRRLETESQLFEHAHGVETEAAGGVVGAFEVRVLFALGVEPHEAAEPGPCAWRSAKGASGRWGSTECLFSESSCCVASPRIPYRTGTSTLLRDDSAPTVVEDPGLLFVRSRKVACGPLLKIREKRLPAGRWPVPLDCSPILDVEVRGDDCPATRNGRRRLRHPIKRAFVDAEVATRPHPQVRRDLENSHFRHRSTRFGVGWVSEAGLGR